MTIRIAILIFMVSFAAITGWLVLREPAEGTVANTPPAPKGSEESSQPSAPTPQKQPAHQNGPVTITNVEIHVKNKLNNIIIPVVEFEDTPPEEALNYLRVSLNPEGTSSNHGFNFVFRKPTMLTDDIPDSDADLMQLPTVTYSGNNKTLKQILDVICDQTGYQWRINENKILLTPLN